MVETSNVCQKMLIYLKGVLQLLYALLALGQLGEGHVLHALEFDQSRFMLVFEFSVALPEAGFRHVLQRLPRVLGVLQSCVHLHYPDVVEGLESRVRVLQVLNQRLCFVELAALVLVARLQGGELVTQTENLVAQTFDTLVAHNCQRFKFFSRTQKPESLTKYDE